ncbi:hypothetical protein SAMN05192588_1065 [Nonlabens sp. Hel1_33_55]|nr:hypothetical protein SAMN05192588_1065 [Nonlabens sp. Hel1_33_55]
MIFYVANIGLSYIKTVDWFIKLGLLANPKSANGIGRIYKTELFLLDN